MTVWAFAHPGSTSRTCRKAAEGVLHATLIEEQTSEHLPGVAVLGMPLQPTTQAGFHITPASRCNGRPDRFQALLPRGSPEHQPQASEGGQDQRRTEQPTSTETVPATSKKTCRLLQGDASLTCDYGRAEEQWKGAAYHSPQLADWNTINGSGIMRVVGG